MRILCVCIKQRLKREYYQNCSVLGCVTQCSQSAAHSYKQFLQVQQIGPVIQWHKAHRARVTHCSRDTYTKDNVIMSYVSEKNFISSCKLYRSCLFILRSPRQILEVIRSLDLDSRSRLDSPWQMSVVSGCSGVDTFSCCFVDVRLSHLVVQIWFISKGKQLYCMYCCYLSHSI